MAEIPVPEREHNEIEVELGLSEEETRTEAKRCLRCGLTCYNREVVGRVGREAELIRRVYEVEPLICSNSFPRFTSGSIEAQI